ncbi:4-hydroxy-tetrahydrodipicolinate synthase, chloroplastic [Salvia divinorum]|uniref:4-hydroxy-tetrahydrodipicolinate synthase, chloroplastic n=1 Tax=Salvia divinorum TaxID=28513 RepID=A0ABD1GKB7_SALDI
MATVIGCFSLKSTHQSEAALHRRIVNAIHALIILWKWRASKWRSPRAAVVPNFHLPMRRNEVKNRGQFDLSKTNVDDIKYLRLITAIKTPYLPDGRFDLEAYDALVNMQIEDGVDGVIVCGTTGEGQLMSWDEHIMLIGHTVNCFGSSVKVIGNAGSNSTREAIHATEQGFAVGMHAGCGTPHQPLLWENLLGRAPTQASRSALEMIRVEQYTSLVRDDKCHNSRWDHSATGVISVTGNLVPRLMRELMFGGKNPSLNAKLIPLNPIGVNTALAQLGVVRPVFRLPYVSLPLGKRVEFVNIVNELGRENFIGEKDVRVLDDDDFILIGRY